MTENLLRHHPALYRRLYSSTIVGAEVNLAPIFKGWNLWLVNQKLSLDIDPMMVGVSRDRRLRVWVEDEVKRGPGVDTGDIVRLKGDQVDVLASVPAALRIAATKEQVPGPPMLLDGESELRVVRFFNRGLESSIPWPHDGDYILDRVYVPDPKIPETGAPPPKTTVENVVKPVGEGIERVLMLALGVATVALVASVVMKK